MIRDNYICVFGDFMSNTAEVIRTEGDLEELLSGATHNVCNFEAPIQTDSSPIIKSGPVLSQTNKSVDFLIKHHFDIFLLANNHMMDYGEKGADATVSALKGFTTIGYGKAKEAYAIKTVKVVDKTIGMLSLCQTEFGTIDSTENTRKGTARITSYDICNIIKEGKKENDFIIVFPHAGLEHVDAPLPQWRDLYRRLIDYGADAIIASHPHVPQGWEYYHEAPIFYSLGNFYFERRGRNSYWNSSLCVKIVIEDKLKFEVIGISFDKTSIKKDEGLKSHIDSLNKLLNDESQYAQYIREVCKKTYETYRYQLIRSNRGIAFTNSIQSTLKLLVSAIINKRHREDFLNCFQCETHRWVIENYVKMKL